MENKNFVTCELITPEVKAEKEIIHCCPHCGISHYSVGATMATMIDYQTIIKDGKVISQDPNVYTTTCHCLNCNQDFKIIRKGNTYEIYKQ